MGKRAVARRGGQETDMVLFGKIKIGLLVALGISFSLVIGGGAISFYLRRAVPIAVALLVSSLLLVSSAQLEVHEWKRKDRKRRETETDLPRQ